MADVQKWVGMRQLPTGLDYLVTTDYPPVIGIADTIKVSSESDLKREGKKPPKAHWEIANGLLNCHKAFKYGEKFNLPNDNFCYPCQKIEFSEQIKNLGEIKGLDKFLKTTRIASNKNSPTFAQVLFKRNPETLGHEVPQNLDVIHTTQDLYIFYVVLSEEKWGLLSQQQRNTARATSLLAPFIPGFGSWVGATAGTVAAADASTGFFSDDGWNPKVILAQAQQIERVCNT